MAEKDIPLVTGVTPAADNLVEVVAPMDLQEGYELQVDVNGRNQSVKVPPGGVKEGQSFQAVPYASTTTAVTSTKGVPHYIPTGKWRDGLCSCCTFGPCHAMCCLGFWFEPILVGQVMTRMGRTTFGGRGKHPSTNSTCKYIAIAFLLVIIVQAVLRTIMGLQHCAGGRNVYNFDENKYEIQCPDDTVEEPTDLYQTLNLVPALSLSFLVSSSWLALAAPVTRCVNSTTLSPRAVVVVMIAAAHFGAPAVLSSRWLVIPTTILRTMSVAAPEFAAISEDNKSKFPTLRPSRRPENVMLSHASVRKQVARTPFESTTDLCSDLSKRHGGWLFIVWSRVLCPQFRL
eukprot:CAMPEP_0194027554 /NCGR_PEP_ID=MMETSP0009_2-20130614/1695_1 /TAXON_ID=210454 /ORGANISM="Grammatophora oceanica, Strain CCMP 410" /LENGTH=343 /DNA_ID=CAMNT_0038666667 /DNA_START=12 /DNA_END=1044 /DNA_ORIENTATION=-